MQKRTSVPLKSNPAVGNATLTTAQIKKMTVKDLKAQLKQRGEKLAGKKVHVFFDLSAIFVLSVFVHA